MRCCSLYQPVERAAASLDEYSRTRALTQAEMEILWLYIKLDDDTHTAQIAVLYVAVFLFHTLTLFQPSVSDIDVSHRGLQGAE